jgi:hypothetical protein
VLIPVVALLFALIEGALVLRLLLPFLRVPKALQEYVPGLINATDALTAPFRLIIEPFDLDAASRIPGVEESGFGRYVDRVDPAILVALVGWAVIGGIVVIVLRLVARAS